MTDPHIHPPVATTTTTLHPAKPPMNKNIIFAVVVILYEILALPIYGVLFRISSMAEDMQDYGGVLLVSIATILLIIGMRLLM